MIRLLVLVKYSNSQAMNMENGRSANGAIGSRHKQLFFITIEKQDDGSANAVSARKRNGVSIERAIH